MRRKPVVEILVGLFMLAGAAALVFLAFQVSGLAQFRAGKYYEITAQFDNIGDLKPRAPVTIGGVRVGQVSEIVLDRNTYRATVTLDIEESTNNIPTDSTANIFTQGLLGSNYISISPGFDNTMLKNGDQIQNTRSALILENLIGQFLLSGVKSEDKDTEGQ